VTPARGFPLAAFLIVTSSCAGATRPAAPAPVWLADADSAAVDSVAPGVTHTRAWFASGPWSIHVLRIDEERCGPVIRAAKAGPPLSARATTSYFGVGALAAINADFFAIPGGTPVGAAVTGGRILVGPGDRPVLAETATGRVQGRARIEGWIAVPGDTARVVQVNRVTNPAPGGVALFTEWIGTDSVGGGLDLRRIGGDTDDGRATVVGPAAGGAEPVPVGTVRVEGDPAWLGRRAAGDTVAWHVELRVEGSADPAVEAVGAFPILLAGGNVVLDAQPGVRPEFGERRHPRTAVGWNARALFWVVVDGRRAPFSDGMTLAELADLFARLGAREAINLDGGGSTAMTVRGRVVNRPSDATGERPVGNALVLERCEPVRRSPQRGATVGR